MTATLSTSLAFAHAGPAADDPLLWLEDVAGQRAMDWVEKQNAVTKQELEAEPEFLPLFQRLRTIYNSRERIPYVVKRGPHYYNFWRDGQHVRGLWRRTTLEEYRKTEPLWETLLDVDALAESEKENWVWAGADCLYPDYQRCLISLSRGGGDAEVVREYDLAARDFVADGFNLPESKGGLSWIDRDTVYVETDFGPGSMTDSGYPRIAKEWRRGTPLAEARVVFEGQQGDVSVSAHRSRDRVDGQDVWRDWVVRSITFYDSETFLRQDGQLVKLDIPSDAGAGTYKDQMIVTLRSDWNIGGKVWPQGAMLATGFDEFLRGGRDFAMLYEPGPRKSLDGVSETRDHLLVNELDNVRNRIVVLTLASGKWSRVELPIPAIGTVGIAAVDSDESNDYFLTVTGPTMPTTLSMGSLDENSELRTTPGGGPLDVLKSLPAFFDAEGVTVTQHEAVSKDGTRIPYFQVSPKGYQADGHNPVLLYGYGGFEVPIAPPGYSSTVGSAWLEQGGVYVLAAIRGGGEFGPAWHQAAIKENKQKSFDDFIAVAEDLIARKVTSPAHLGIEGGSNGGLLVGAVMVQRPDLFGAVVCQVPLLDMRRYHQLLAGASWIGEYGDPDDTAMWQTMARYSPYQNVKAGVAYPPVLFTTSTRDDRVHPGHARKMAAKMQQQGHRVLYYENTEGGHAGAANNDQMAYMTALEYTFLRRMLR